MWWDAFTVLEPGWSISTLETIAAAGCSLWATILIARLCAVASDSLQGEPALPTATLQP